MKKPSSGEKTLKKEIKEILKAEGEKSLLKIPGVGQGIAFHISELLKKGHFQEYDRLKKKTPVNISELSTIEEIGPKMIKILYQKLKIKNLKDLERAAQD